MCCLPSKKAKILTTIFSMLSVLGGLLVIGLCFGIVLNSDLIDQSLDIFVSEEVEED